MKLLTMKCIKDPERMEECFEPDNQEKRYFVKLENKYDKERYEWFLSNLNDKERQGPAWRGYYKGYWGGELSDEFKQKISDDDVYYYIMPYELEPAIGRTYTDADGLVWERID